MLLVVLSTNNNRKDIWVVSVDSCFLDPAVQSAWKVVSSNRHGLTYTLTPCGIGKALTVSLSVINQSIYDVVMSYMWLPILNALVMQFMNEGNLDSSAVYDGSNVRISAEVSFHKAAIHSSNETCWSGLGKNHWSKCDLFLVLLMLLLNLVVMKRLRNMFLLVF